MNNVLLIGSDQIKTYTSLNDNVFDKNVFPAIRTSQDIELQQVIGSCLYDAICSMVSDGSISEESHVNYKNLLDKYIQPFLTYVVLSHLVMEVSTKMTNFGTVVSNDEHIENVGIQERDMVRKQWEYYSDAYKRNMQCYLKANRDLFPELDCGCGCCDSIRPNLDSNASSQLFLGGKRGKHYWN